jgi:hypothetical protein
MKALKLLRLAIGIVLLLALLIPAWAFVLGVWLCQCAFAAVDAFVEWRRPVMPSLEDTL